MPDNLDHTRHPETLFGRLQALMFLRVVMVSLFLGASVFIQIKSPKPDLSIAQNMLYMLIGLVYLLTLFYAVAFKYLRRLAYQAYIQMLIDVLIVSAIIYATGGIESIFPFLYILVIIAASMLLHRKGGLIIASASSIGYGILIDAHFYGLIQPPPLQGLHPTDFSAFNVFYLILVHMAAFFLTGFLSGLLSEQVRETHVELKARQTDIRKLEALNEGIIQNIASGIIVLDENARVLLINPAARTLFRLGEKEGLGQPVDRLLPEVAAHPGVAARLIELEAAGPSPLHALSLTSPAGENRHLRLSISSLELPAGDKHGKILFFQDVTRIKHFEDRLKRMENLATVGELAAKVAHEIRNPMASISGSIQLLQIRQDEDPVNSRLLSIMSRETGRIEGLIHDFLTFARPKNPSYRTFQLSDIAEEITTLFRNSPHWREGIHIESRIEPLEMTSDPDQLSQALWNMLRNAAEALPDAGGTITITAVSNPNARSLSDRPLVTITLHDSGKGFIPADLDQIFHPFFTTRKGSSGLGLPIVKGIIEGMGGSVNAENHPEGGAQIIIELPLHPDQTSETEPDPAPGASGPDPSTPWDSRPKKGPYAVRT